MAQNRKRNRIIYTREQRSVIRMSLALVGILWLALTFYVAGTVDVLIQ